MDPAVALDGRALGRRGAQTRRRLLDATAELLETHGIRDLRVVDIARAVGSSPATFYQYFRDVEEAVLALAEEVGDEIAPLVDAARDAVGRRGRARRRSGARRRLRRLLGPAPRRAAHAQPRRAGGRRAVPRRAAPHAAAVHGEPHRQDRRGAGRGPGGRARCRRSAASAALVALIERMAAFHRELEQLGISPRRSRGDHGADHPPDGRRARLTLDVVRVRRDDRHRELREQRLDLVGRARRRAAQPLVGRDTT